MQHTKRLANFCGQMVEVEVITPETPVRRKAAKLPDTWARIPHGRGLKLAKQAKCPILAVLLALEVAIHKAHSNRVVLTNDLLKLYGITHQSKARGLRQLAAAGVISVDRHDRAAPVVTHHWYDLDGKLYQSGAPAPK